MLNKHILLFEAYKKVYGLRIKRENPCAALGETHYNKFTGWLDTSALLLKILTRFFFSCSLIVIKLY